MRVFVEFAYNGSAYHGSQVQPNGVTVQEVLQNAFLTLLREPVALTFAGRTDAGVHAEKMVAHADIEPALMEQQGFASFDELVARLNRLLPKDIAVLSIYRVADDLHARFSATSRTYEYRITMRKDPFTGGLRTFVPAGLDFDAMNEAAAHLLGTHDFASFCKVHTDVKTTLCTVTDAHWVVSQSCDTTNLDSENNPAYAVFRISADRFLRNMVRAVVGTLFAVGRHTLTLEQFDAILAARNRCAAGQSAPPEGLFLVDITYP